jgi:hypothetical protein
MSEHTKTICPVCGGDCPGNGCDKPPKKTGYYVEGPVVDPAPYLLKVTQIAQAKTDKRLTKFEAKFLKEIAHAAARFHDTFRISPKQARTLDKMWADHYLPSLIDAKTEED